MKALIPVWESHMAERLDRDRPYSEPDWWIHVDTILRIKKCDPSGEYVIETRDKLRYYAHRELWEELVKC